MATQPQYFIEQKTYNFDTLAPSVLGTRVRNAVLLGTLSYDLAILRENIDLKYRQIYPILPPGTPDIPKKLRYYCFRTESGQITTLCEQWINIDTIEEVLGVNFSVYFAQAQPADIENVRALLVAAGYTNFKID